MLEIIFLIFILVFSNYIPNLLGDKPTPGKVNTLITNNIYILHVLFILVVYFSVKGLDDENTNIFHKTKSTLLLWLLFIIIMKLKTNYIILLFLLFMSLYMLNEYMIHHKYHGRHKEDPGWAEGARFTDPKDINSKRISADPSIYTFPWENTNNSHVNKIYTLIEINKIVILCVIVVGLIHHPPKINSFRDIFILSK